MRLKDIVPATLVALALLGLAFNHAAADKPAASAEPADAKTIAKLIEQLGSDSFEDREAAQKALAKIGEPALEALEKAAKNTDAEIRKRAGALAESIGTRVRSAAILTPREVHLVYKDTPLKAAIADFEKKAGVGFNLIDADSKLKDKRITLDTGKVPFWTALEKFCDAAGLVEADPSKVPPIPFPMGRPGVDVPPPPLPPMPPRIGGIGGAVGGGRKLTDEEIKKLKEAVEKAREAELRKRKEAIEAEKKAREEAEKKARDEAARKGAAGARPAVAEAAVAVAVAEEKPADKPVADKPLPPMAAVPMPVPPPVIGGPAILPVPPMAGFGGGFPGGPGMPMMNPFQHGKINLMAGKPAKVPTDKTTSVRVRVAPEGTDRPFAAGDAKVLTVMIQAAPEPRLRWQQLVNITLDKALDDNGQKLTKHEPPMPGGPMGGGAVIGGGVIVFPGGGIGMPGFPGMGPGMFSYSNDGINQNIAVLLNKGEKASKKLKELSGTITANFLGEAKPHIVADNIMKAAGKTFKGDKGGSITVKSATKAGDGTVTVTFEFDQPADITPETQMDVPGGVNPVGPAIGGPPIRIRPAIRPLPGVIKPLPPVKADPAADPKPADDKPAKADEPKPAEKPAGKPAEAKAEAAVAFAVEAKPAIALPGVAVGGPAIALPPMAGGGFGGGVAIGPGGMPMMIVNQGLTLQDDKGNVLSAQVQIDWRKARVGGAIGAKPVMEYVAVYKPQKGQPAEPSKLVFTGRHSIQVNIPFKLENIDLK